MKHTFELNKSFEVGLLILIAIGGVSAASARQNISVADFINSDIMVVREYEIASKKLIRTVKVDLPPLMAVNHVKSNRAHNKFYITSSDSTGVVRNFLINTSSHHSVELKPPNGYYLLDVSLGQVEQLLLAPLNPRSDPLIAASYKTVRASEPYSLPINSTVNGDVLNFTDFPYLQRISKLRAVGLAKPGVNDVLSIEYSWTSLTSMFYEGPYSPHGYLGPNNSFIIRAGSPPMRGFDLKIDQRHIGMNFIRYDGRRTIGFENSRSMLLSPKMIGPYTAFQTTYYLSDWNKWFNNQGIGVVVYDSSAKEVALLPGRLVVLVEGSL